MLGAGAYRRRIENPIRAGNTSLPRLGRMTYGKRPRATTGRASGVLAAGLLGVIAAIAAALGYRLVAASSSTAASLSDVVPGQQRGAAGRALPGTAWPADGQAAVQVGQSRIQAGPNQHEAAIASVAKVMTAYVVLGDHPLRLGQDGPTITLTDADVADTDRRVGQDESVVPVEAGEQLTERQALQALLLPSANNIAAVLAHWDAGSASRFVARMNAAARSLGMTHTRYTDPSGYDDATVSTAADQVRIVDRAMRLPVFAGIVAMPTATLPVAGTVHNTDRLLGYDGFVGVKTGSDSAAGGCFAFRAVRRIDGQQTTITGSCWASPATPGPRPVSRPPTPWSTASPVGGLRRIRRNQPPRRELRPWRAPGGEPVSMHSAHEGRNDEESTPAGRPGGGRFDRRDLRGLWRRPQQRPHEPHGRSCRQRQQRQRRQQLRHDS